jgi:hypothetical protein
MKILSRVLATLFLAGGLASAATINFDDLADPGPGASILIPNGYGGLDWNNFWYLNGDTYTDPIAYHTGVVSPHNVAFNGFGDQAIFSDGDFTLNSAYFTSAWEDNNVMTVRGFHLGTLLDTLQVVLNRQGPTFVTFNWAGVDQVVFDTSNYQMAMDDLTINGSSSPEGGATLALLGMALLGLFGVRRKVS